jgi:hypothetical protein
MVFLAKTQECTFPGLAEWEPFYTLEGICNPCCEGVMGPSGYNGGRSSKSKKKSRLEKWKARETRRVGRTFVQLGAEQRYWLGHS